MAQTQDKTSGPQEQPKSKQAIVDGVKGMFFPMPVARLMLKDLKLGKAALAMQPKLELRIELEKHKTKLLELDVETVEKMSQIWKSTAEDQAKRLSKTDTFWRSPTLWFALGVVVAGGAFGAAVAITK